MKKEYGVLINGEWLETGDRSEIINPYDRSVVATVNRATDKEAQRAVESVAGARETMARMTANERANILRGISRGIEARAEEIAKSISMESGKPLKAARGEATRGTFTFSVAADEVSRLEGEVIPMDAAPNGKGRWGITRYYPAGPVFGISPFNFPLNLVGHKVAPAIAAGNPIIIKPAGNTPITALILGEIAIEAGMPPEAISILPAPVPVAEKAMNDERIKVWSFTGSARVGWALKAKAGQRKVILELGGNAGMLVDENADIKRAAARAAFGAFAYSGQVCISVQRIYVLNSVFEEFKEEFLRQVDNLKLGDPLDETTDMGPMIDEPNAERIEAWVEEARKEGAKIERGGERKENFFPPTVLTATTPDMKVVCMEAFAPLVTLVGIESFEEGLRAINDSDYGLQAGVFTDNIKNAFHAFDTLEVGGVIINDVPTFRVDHMPYGGVKGSGFGREGLKYSIREMMEQRLMVVTE